MKRAQARSKAAECGTFPLCPRSTDKGSVNPSRLSRSRVVRQSGRRARSIEVSGSSLAKMTVAPASLAVRQPTGRQPVGGGQRGHRQRRRLGADRGERDADRRECVALQARRQRVDHASPARRSVRAGCRALSDDDRVQDRKPASRMRPATSSNVPLTATGVTAPNTPLGTRAAPTATAGKGQATVGRTARPTVVRRS
jgi:hypothetical protein